MVTVLKVEDQRTAPTREKVMIMYPVRNGKVRVEVTLEGIAVTVELNLEGAAPRVKLMIKIICHPVQSILSIGKEVALGRTAPTRENVMIICHPLRNGKEVGAVVSLEGISVTVNVNLDGTAPTVKIMIICHPVQNRLRIGKDIYSGSSSPRDSSNQRKRNDNMPPSPKKIKQDQ